jgi:hypothetical protein
MKTRGDMKRRRGRGVRGLRLDTIVPAIVASFALLSGAARVEAADATLLRVFLADGTVVVSYGEYARVGDRVVFSMPLGGESDAPVLHLVNLPASLVNWDKTTQYANAARAAHYAAAAGDTDYALLTGRIAQTLNEIAVAADDRHRLDLALQARRELAQWPDEHYGYRADDVRQILGMLDEAVAELRALTGETRFDLNLVAVAPDAPPSMALLPEPGAQDALAGAMTVARLTDVPADRTSLLSAIVRALDANTSALPRAWARRQRREALAALTIDARADRAYGDLTKRVLQAASNAAAQADVLKVESVLEGVQREDQRLGRQRPAEVEALVTAVRERLDAARRLRLARDQWAARRQSFAVYRRATRDAIREFTRYTPRLEAIRRLAGPGASALTKLGAQFEETARQLAGIEPPSELMPVHALLISAATLAANAADARREAVRSGSLAGAWDASAAAAGALMLASKARADMDSLFTFPQLR